MAVLNRPVLHPPTRLLPRIRSRALVGIALFGVVIAAMAQVVQTSDATSRGYQIQQLEQQRLTLEAQVHQKEAEIAGLSSLDRIEREARTRLGLVPAGNRLYMEMSEPVPQEQLLPSRFAPPEEASPAAHGRSWWRRLLDFLPL